MCPQTISYLRSPVRLAEGRWASVLRRGLSPRVNRAWKGGAGEAELGTCPVTEG